MKPILLICLVLAGCNEFDPSKHLACTTTETETMRADFKFCQDKFGPNANSMCEDEAIARNCRYLNTAGKIWALTEGPTNILQLEQANIVLPAEAIPQDNQ